MEPTNFQLINQRENTIFPSEENSEIEAGIHLVGRPSRVLISQSSRDSSYVNDTKMLSLCLNSSSQWSPHITPTHRSASLTQHSLAPALSTIFSRFGDTQVKSHEDKYDLSFPLPASTAFCHQYQYQHQHHHPHHQQLTPYYPFQGELQRGGNLTSCHQSANRFLNHMVQEDTALLPTFRSNSTNSHVVHPPQHMSHHLTHYQHQPKIHQMQLASQKDDDVNNGKDDTNRLCFSPSSPSSHSPNTVSWPLFTPSKKSASYLAERSSYLAAAASDRSSLSPSSSDSRTKDNLPTTLYPWMAVVGKIYCISNRK